MCSSMCTSQMTARDGRTQNCIQKASNNIKAITEIAGKTSLKSSF